MMRIPLALSIRATTVTLALSGGGLSTLAFAGELPMIAAVAAPAPAAAEPERSAVSSNDRDDQRIRKLHERLEITGAQEALWVQVAQVMRANDDKMDALSEARHAKALTMTAVEDLRSYGEVTEAHAAGIRAFVPAFETLYNSMSASQKLNADKVFRHVNGKMGKKKS
jgi:hypothetical protein